MKLVHDGVLQIPLYHGTSSVWLTSIEEHGLGAIDPLEQYQILKILRALYDEAEATLAADPKWTARREVLKPMLEQRVTSGGMNYRHGAVYLSPSRSTASRYAMSNRFGSEIISQCVLLLEQLRQDRFVPAPGVQRLLDPLEGFMTKVGRPIVLEVRSVPVSVLRRETGEEASQHFDRIQRTIDDRDDRLARQRTRQEDLVRRWEAGDVDEDLVVEFMELLGSGGTQNEQTTTAEFIELVCQQDNFELLGSISMGQIKVHFVDVSQKE